MEHYNKFILEVETVDIRVTEYYQTPEGNLEDQSNDYPEIKYKKAKYLDLSHYSQSKSNYESEIRQLQQLALNDILLLTPGQIKQQLKRLEQIQNRCKDFWKLFKELHKDFREKLGESEIILMNIERLFIVAKHERGSISQRFLSNFHDAVMYKHGYTSGLIEQVKKAVGLNGSERMTKCKRYPECKCFEAFEKPAIGVDPENSWLFVSCIKELERSILSLEWVEFENSVDLILPYFVVVPETLHDLFVEKITNMLEIEMSWKMPKPLVTLARIRQALQKQLNEQKLESLT